MTNRLKQGRKLGEDFLFMNKHSFDGGPDSISWGVRRRGQQMRRGRAKRGGRVIT